MVLNWIELVDGGIELVEAGGTRTASGEGGERKPLRVRTSCRLIQNLRQGPTDLNAARIPPGLSAPAGWLLVGWTEGLRAPIPGVPGGSVSSSPPLIRAPGPPKRRLKSPYNDYSWYKKERKCSYF